MQARTAMRRTFGAQLQYWETVQIWFEQMTRGRPIGPTDPDGAYITCNPALNLPEHGHHADWHRTGWHLGRDGPPLTCNPGTTALFGPDGIVDVRRRLRAINHVAGWSPIRIWGAVHWRAMLDTAALAVQLAQRKIDAGQRLTQWPGTTPQWEDLQTLSQADADHVLEAAKAMKTLDHRRTVAWDLWTNEMERERRICDQAA